MSIDVKIISLKIKEPYYMPILATTLPQDKYQPLCIKTVLIDTHPTIAIS